MVDPRPRAAVAAMQGYVPGEQPQSGKFIKLNTNENPYPPSEQVATAIDHALRAGLQRYPDPMANTFRRVASQVLDVPADWILCGNGSDDILTIATRTFVDAGGVLRMPTPSYVLYRPLAQIQGARTDEVAFLEDWTLDVPRFVESDPDLQLAMIPNPNSPSGTMIAPDVLLQVAQQLPCPLLIDEAYADFADTNCLALVAQQPNIMVSRTLSKSYGLAGLRFGFVVAQPSVIEQLAKVKDSYNCDALSIAGATAAMGDQTWLRQNRLRVIATRDRLVESLAQLGFIAQPSQANFVWCIHPQRRVQPIYEELKRQQVLIRYMSYDGWGDGLRISVGTDAQIDALLSLLERMLTAEPQAGQPQRSDRGNTTESSG